MQKIRKDDDVIVLTGKDKGRTGKVLKVLPKEGRAVVSGINIIKKHTKQSQTDEGGIKATEAPIQLSNLALVDPKDGKATRVGFKVNEDGSKVRVAKRSGVEING
jgi:large subunit ribosomal protein L24